MSNLIMVNNIDLPFDSGEYVFLEWIFLITNKLNSFLYY